MRFLSFVLLSLSIAESAHSAGYIGGNYSYGAFSNDTLKENKVSVKGPSYGGFLGFGKDFVGLEAFYQTFSVAGDIKHDGETHTLNGDATAMGAALRFSFDLIYLRLGAARYSMNQSIDIADDESRDAAEEIYNVQKKGSSKNGMLYGVGMHYKFSWFRGFVDYSRYQVNGLGNYDVIGVGLSFNIPERLFNPAKY